MNEACLPGGCRRDNGIDNGKTPLTPHITYEVQLINQSILFVTWPKQQTTTSRTAVGRNSYKKPRYRKYNRAMRPIESPENCT